MPSAHGEIRDSGVSEIDIEMRTSRVSEKMMGQMSAREKRSRRRFIQYAVYVCDGRATSKWDDHSSLRSNKGFILYEDVPPFT